MSAKMASDKLISAASVSQNVAGRSDANKTFGTADFDDWIGRIFDGLSFSTALDLCCGTGNQLVLYASRPGITRLVGVDLSRDSLDVAGQRMRAANYTGEIDLLDSAVEDVFDSAAVAKQRFDLVSCCYGLYYAQDTRRTLTDMMTHATEGGAVIIVGPYGANNAALFRMMERHMTIPELVLRSSSTFMEEEVVPLLAEQARLYTDTFVNRIIYPDTDSVMNYLRRTTFFEPAADDAVGRDVERHIAEAGSFVVEKHVMACVALV